MGDQKETAQLTGGHSLDAITRETFDLIRRAKNSLSLRLDDIGADDEHVRRIVERLLDAGLCLNMEVIPSLLERATADWLKALRSMHHERVEVHQHGWSHTNHEPTGKKQEFGPARSFKAKLEDMWRGRRALEENLPELFFPVFCPPWNRLDADSLRACAEVGYHAISAFDSVPGGLHEDVADLSATFDWKAAETEDEANLAMALDHICHNVCEGRDTVVMLHPQVLSVPSLRSLLRLFEAAARSGTQTLTFSQMLDRRGKASA